MTHDDRGPFVELLIGLGETYSEPVSEAKLEIYFRALEDLSLESIRLASSIHVRTQKFFPRPSELRDAVAGTVDDRAELAWIELLQIVRRVGYYGKPVWPDHVLERAALEIYGGWRALCERLPGEGPELLGVAKQFKAAYRAYLSRERKDALFFPTQDEARERLGDLKQQLEQRGLPTHGML